MKPVRIEGPNGVYHCDGCNRDGIGGTEPYISASTEEVRQPEDWYTYADAQYCAQCAAKLIEEDPTRSITTFYTNTEGTEIDPEVL